MTNLIKGNFRSLFGFSWGSPAKPHSFTSLPLQSSLPIHTKNNKISIFDKESLGDVVKVLAYYVESGEPRHDLRECDTSVLANLLLNYYFDIDRYGKVFTVGTPYSTLRRSVADFLVFLANDDLTSVLSLP